MAYSSYWRRKFDGAIFILVEVDPMFDIVTLKGPNGEFHIESHYLYTDFEKAT